VRTPENRIWALGILFDLDGVLVDSSRCIFRAWCEWATAHGLDVETTFSLGQGRRTLDHIRLAAPELATPTEVAHLDELEEKYISATTVQPGARDAVEQLVGLRWGVVTSCGTTGAIARLRQAEIERPPTLVSGEDVRAGKPAPDGYLLGAERLGLRPDQVLAFEDAPSGIVAANRAAIRVVGLTTTHSPGDLQEADFRIPDLTHVRFRREPVTDSIEVVLLPSESEGRTV
jgi:mannitol-1-/sugar-/sorbitol-6-phosphatase